MDFETSLKSYRHERTETEHFSRLNNNDGLSRFYYLLAYSCILSKLCTVSRVLELKDGNNEPKSK